MVNIDLFSLFATIGLKDNGFTQGIKDATGKTDNLTGGVKGLIQTVGGISLVAKSFQLIGSSIGAAVERYDTLNRFPRTLQSMGFEASATDAAMRQLTDGIQGLPTRLDDIVSTAQNLTVLTGNLQQSTDTALALNNAFLASGASSADASRGMQQYTQQLSKGSVDMMSWRTLQETMGYALRETAEAMGFAGRSATNDLYKALQSGSVTFSEFNRKLIELSNATGGFAEMAKTSSRGIGTSFANMQTAVVRGITAVIAALDKNRNIQTFIESVGKGFENLLKTLGSVASIATTLLAPALWILANGMGAVLSVIGPLTAAFIAYRATLIITSIIQALSVGFTALEAVMLTLPVVMNLVTAAQTGLNVAMTSNPIGIVIAAVAGLVTGLIALYNWLGGSTKKQQEATSSTDALTNSLNNSTDAASRNVSAAGEIAKSGAGISASYGAASKSVKELSDQIYDSFQEAKAAADEFNKDMMGRGYILVKDAEGRARAISNSSYKLYENLKDYIDEYYAGASMTEKVAAAKTIYTNQETLNQIKRDYYGMGPSTGAAVADGLASGMLANRGKVQSAARTLANDVSKEMNKALEIKSPSKVTGRVGKNAVLGLVNSIIKGRESVKSAVSSIADVVGSGMSGGADYGVGFGGGGTNDEFIVETTTTDTASSDGGSTIYDYSTLTVYTNDQGALAEIEDWWKNKRVRERAAGV